MFVQVTFFPWNDFYPKHLPKEHYKGITGCGNKLKPTALHVKESLLFHHDVECF